MLFNSSLSSAIVSSSPLSSKKFDCGSSGVGSSSSETVSCGVICSLDFNSSKLVFRVEISLLRLAKSATIFSSKLLSTTVLFVFSVVFS